MPEQKRPKPSVGHRARHGNHRRLTLPTPHPQEVVADDLNLAELLSERMLGRTLTVEERKGVIAMATSRDPTDRRDWQAMKDAFKP